MEIKLSKPSLHSILLIEDDKSQADLIKFNISSKGYDVISAYDGETGIEKCLESIPSLIIIDWMLPNMTGIEVCRRIRQEEDIKDIPIIMLTAKGEENDRIMGLNSGADDYIVKPFSPSELVARIKALLRRTHRVNTNETITYKDIEIDLATYKVTRKNIFIHLGPKEFQLLLTLLKRPGRIYSREQLLDMVWGRNIYVETRTVDVHIRRLRKALNVNGMNDCIRTVRSAGYAIEIEG